MYMLISIKPYESILQSKNLEQLPQCLPQDRNFDKLPCTEKSTENFTGKLTQESLKMQVEEQLLNSVNKCSFIPSSSVTALSYSGSKWVKVDPGSILGIFGVR